MFKNKELNYKEIGFLILIAYTFSFMIRMIWISWASQNTGFFWNNEIMINTNDGYFFASAVEYLLSGAHADNPRVHIAIDSYPGVVYTTYFLTKFTPFSLDTVILYLPAVISSLAVIPMILTGKVLKLPWVGFFAALVGSIGLSYYNRTMAGYYDTDMFSVFLQFTILYLFLLTIYEKKDKNVLFLAIALILYPFFYPQGLSLIYGIFVLWVLYQLIFQNNEQNVYLFIIVASIALWASPIWLKLLLIITVYVFLEQLKTRLDTKKFFYLTIFALFIFLFFGNIFGLVWGKVIVYLNRGVEESGLHFYQVIQTVREAGKISWEIVADRIIGHPALLLLSLLGYILLVYRHKAFILALPLIGVGVFAHWAGLRFTVYAVPVAAFSLIYFFYFITKFISPRPIAYSIFVVASLVSLYPNISHIIGYKVPTVLNKVEVEDLQKLKVISSPKDYTLGWWDYGYPIWYYSNTSSLIDGAKHHNDNFLISTLMQTQSQKLVANLSRLAVETYVSSGYKVVADTLFKNKKKDQLDPNSVLDELEVGTYVLPEKTRDIYLYLPYRMLDIFPTVALFGNLDLTTGKPKRLIKFYPTQVVGQKDNILTFANGIKFDLKSGDLFMGSFKEQIKSFVVTENGKNGSVTKQVQNFSNDNNYVMVFMKSYGKFIIMDVKTYHSTYVQMFILENYDENLFELVVSSPYSKIYKLKK